MALTRGENADTTPLNVAVNPLRDTCVLICLVVELEDNSIKFHE